MKLRIERNRPNNILEHAMTEMRCK